MFSSIVGKISALTTAATDFPYTVGDEVIEWKRAKDCGTVWKLMSGTRNSDSEPVSIFELDKKSSVAFRIDAAKNCIQKLKTIRHPNILKFEAENDTDDKLQLVTEAVLPLSASIDKVGCACHINEAFNALGLHQLASALSFVHNDLGVIHGCVMPSSVFVTKAGDWKLGGFELCHTYGKLPDHFSSNWDILPTRYKPKEMASNFTLEALTQNPVHALDAWCLGCIIYEIFNGRFSKPQELSKMNKISVDLQPHYKRLLATKPSSRLATKGLLSSPFFKHPLVRTVTFLDHIALKSDTEKGSFYKNLDANIETFPPERCKYRILPALTHILEHGSGSNPVVLSCVLKISVMLTETETKRMITPVVTNMFKNNERGTRINLLRNMDKFIEYIDSKVLSNEIFPAIVNGFTDTSPVLRETSVRAVLHFAPKLDSKLLGDQLLPILEKLQSHDIEPAIRTNTTIVLGKVARFLSWSVAEPILVKAFARSLQDQFVPARSAGIAAFSATIGLWTPRVLARQVLPMVITCTIDNYKTVREAAFKCLETGVQRLRQHALTMSEKPAEAVATGSAPAGRSLGPQGGNISGASRSKIQSASGDTTATDKTTAQAAASAAVAAGSVIASAGSWAVGALASKISAASTAPDSTEAAQKDSAYGTVIGGVGKGISSDSKENDSHIGELKNKPVYNAPNRRSAPLRTTHRTADTDRPRGIMEDGEDEVDDIFSTTKKPPTPARKLSGGRHSKQNPNNNENFDALTFFDDTNFGAATKKQRRKHHKKKSASIDSNVSDNTNDDIDLDFNLSTIKPNKQSSLMDDDLMGQPKKKSAAQMKDFFTDLGATDNAFDNSDVTTSMPSSSSTTHRKKSNPQKRRHSKGSPKRTPPKSGNTNMKSQKDETGDLDSFFDDWN